MVLDPRSLDLAPIALQVLAAVGDDARFKRELPAAQVEIAGRAGGRRWPRPRPTSPQGRRALVAATDGLARFAGARRASRSPPPEGVLSEHERYAHTRREFGPVARRQLVFGLHVHVAVAARTARWPSTTPCAPTCPSWRRWAPTRRSTRAGTSGLDSVRPKLSELLPRQGVPPPIAGASTSWPRPTAGACEAGVARVPGAVVVGAAAASRARHRRGARARHAGHDADTAAVGAVVHALVARLADRHDAGDLGRPAAGWRIEENRWSACRHGTRGTMADLETGRARADRAIACTRCSTSSSPPPRGWAARAELAAGPRADRGQRRPAPARRRRAQVAHARPTAWLADRFLG